MKRTKTNNRFSMLSKGRVAERGVMNKTETMYYNQIKLLPGLVRVWFEPMSLRLSSPPHGQPARYTPDFMILMDDGSTFIDDVKGSGLDDAASIVRIKVAAEQYPLWIFRLAKLVSKRNSGTFQLTEV